MANSFTKLLGNPNLSPFSRIFRYAYTERKQSPKSRIMILRRLHASAFRLQNTLANNLASVLEQSSNTSQNIRIPKTRIQLKRALELRVKKRVKEFYTNGRFKDIFVNVVATEETLQDAYDCIRVNSNVDLASKRDNICFKSIAEELYRGDFDVKANLYSISTKGDGIKMKETIVLPKLILKVVQEAIRMALEVVYRPHFSKISHGCRNGRGYSTALKYIRKEITHPDWCFTLVVNKKLDASIFAKLISTMEEKIEDPSLIAILQDMFDAHVLNVEFGGFNKGQGLPQEGVLSPIMMNIYLDLFDRQMVKWSMKYEALDQGAHIDEDESASGSKLRSWIRRQVNESSDSKNNDKSNKKLHACRFMDEIVFAISGSKEAAIGLKFEIDFFFQNSLFLDVHDLTKIVPFNGPQTIRFLGILIRRSVKESPAVRAVHKLKDKINSFALQKEEIWDAGMTRIGKKCLAHGLKKVKESEIKHLADNSSILCKISRFRKNGMETDHWYKLLLKIWMQDVNAKAAESEEIILSKYIAEQSIPKELKDSYYEFQLHAKEYIASETAATLSLLPNSIRSTESPTITEIIAPINAITKRLSRYGLTSSKGYARASPYLIFQDTNQIIDWFSGIVIRWLRWYSECDNFNDIKYIISEHVRKSCIRTLATKYRLHEDIIENKFDSELSQIPCTEDIDHNMVTKKLDLQAFDNTDSLMYEFSYSGQCLLSLVRMVSQSRPCSCFVMGCLDAAPRVYMLNVMERAKFPGWRTGFSSCIHPSLNRSRIGLCNQHLKDLYLGHISLQSIDFGAWK